MDERATLELNDIMDSTLEDLFRRLYALLSLRRNCYVVSVLLLKGKKHVGSKFYRSSSTSNIVLPNYPIGSRKMSLYESAQRMLKRL